MKGLIAGILENKRIGNCSNNGISSRFQQVLIVGPGIAEIFEESDDLPAVRIVKQTIFGREYVHAEPVLKDGEKPVSWMMGGCFITSSDSRFPADYPIPLHDRTEA